MLLLFGWLGFSQRAAGLDWLAIAILGLFIILLFVCVTLHELGHALAARRFGIGTTGITLLPIGGVARLARLPRQWHEEFWIALAGPAVNVVIVAVLIPIFIIADGLDAATFELAIATPADFVLRLLVANGMLAVFNMLPVFPMDGGRVFRALMARSMEFVRATRIAARVGQAGAVFLALAGVFLLGNPFLPILALFVLFAAGAELRAAEQLHRVSGWRVEDAMSHQVPSIDVEAPVTEAIAEIIRSGTGRLIATDRGIAVGFVRLQDLEAIILSGEAERKLADQVMPLDAALSPADTLEEAMQRLHGGRLDVIPVIDSEGRLAGQLSMGNLDAVIQLNQNRLIVSKAGGITPDRFRPNPLILQHSPS